MAWPKGLSKMKKVIATTISLCALTAFNVNASQYNSEQCDINLEGDFRFAENTLTLKTKADDEVRITDSYTVFLNGQKLVLSAEERTWVKGYYDGIEQSIPQVMTVAAEGVQIANYAVTEVLRGFLGAQSKVASQLEVKLNDLYGKLKDHVYQNPESLTFDSAKLESELGLGPDFNAEVDLIVSDVMENAMGEFLVQMGRSMLNGDGSMASFEQRMEEMGEAIETKVEGQTESIEKEAKKLCEMLTTIDVSESNIQKIKGLSDVDIVTKNKNA
ncbi:MAG: hypothetical protein ACI89W_000391 [Gammaproteobacteria bacterium]|jgi:hypothetical protein